MYRTLFWVSEDGWENISGEWGWVEISEGEWVNGDGWR